MNKRRHYIEKGVAMDSQGLALEIVSLRKLHGLTQADVAKRMKESGRYDTLSKQQISRAEDPNITTGDKLHELRVAVIEELAGVAIRGPLWIVDEAA